MALREDRHREPTHFVLPEQPDNLLLVVRLWREAPGDLLLTAIHMPDKDGIETILELRALSPSLPIVAVSGSGERKCRDLLKDANLAGTIRTLDKPFRLSEVLECVSEVLQSAGWREGRA